MPNVQFSLSQAEYVDLALTAGLNAVSLNRLAKFVLLTWAQNPEANEDFNTRLDALINFDESIYEERSQSTQTP